MHIQLSDHFTYRKLLRFCLSPIVMMLFTSIYSVVDGLFVSNYVGKIPFAALNLICPFLMILGGTGFMIGTGGCALVAKTLGEGDRDLANRYFSMVIKLYIIAGMTLTVLGFAFMRPAARLFGATDVLIDDCVLYGRIVVSCNTAFMLQTGFQTFLAAAEKPRLGLYFTVAAGVTNMVLDALFVGVLQWGLAGAAVATCIAQVVGGVLPLVYFMRPNDSLLRVVRTKMDVRAMLKACGNGASELMSNISASIVGILYNVQLLKYAGEDGVAAYGVLMYVSFAFIAIFIGFTIGSSPIVGYHYGAENHGELHGVLKKSIVIMGTTGAIMSLIAVLMSGTFARIFVGYDAKLTEMTEHAFRLFSASFLLTGFNIFASSFFTALNNGGVSAAISFLRTLVFQLLAVLLLPLVMGLDGIWWAITVAEVFAFILSTGFLLAKRGRYGY